MKKNVSIFLGMTLFLISVSFAEIQNTMQRDPGKVECNDELKRCVYIVQNLTAKDLVAKLNAIVFPGSILTPTEGYINVENLKKINFYMNDDLLRERFISLIPLVDVFDDFVPSSLVQLTTEIFSLSDQGLTELQAQLSTPADPNPAKDIADWIIDSISGGAGLGIKIGTNLLSSVLGSSKVKEESSKISTITQLIPNLAGINYSQSTNIYISPTAGVVKDEMAGININGTVSISATDPDLVLVRDYSIRYGVIDQTSAAGHQAVNILSVSNPQLYLVKGISNVLVSTITQERSNRTEISPISFGKTKNKLQSQVMVITRAEAINFKNLIDDLKKVRTLELHREFSKEEKAKFPQDDLSIESVLSHIRPYSFFSVSGDRILGFRLDTKDARLSNIDKNIEITVKTGGTFSSGSINQKTILSVENLMLSGFKLDNLSMKELEQSVVKIKVSFKLFNQSITVNKVLFYNPATNKFIE